MILKESRKEHDDALNVRKFKVADYDNESAADWYDDPAYIL